MSRDSLLRYRLAVNHLSDDRLPEGSLALAARSGLQDGSPWSGLLSLHLRVHGVTSESWRDVQLAQVFGPRGAIYLVPKADIGVFTLGVFPTEPHHRERVLQAAEAIHALLDGAAMSQSEILKRIPTLDGTRELRWAGSTGTLLPTWDTIDTIVRSARAPELSIEEARVELARRFFCYFGPATIEDLQWWLDSSEAKARHLVETLASELTEVTTDDTSRLVTSETGHLLADPPEPHEMLLLPPEDVYINRRTARPFFEKHDATLWPKAPPPGAVLNRSEVVATWRRRGSRVTVRSGFEMADGHRQAINNLVSDFPLATDDTPKVVFETD